MVDKSKKVPLGELSAYERWELPNIGDPSQVPRKKEVQEKIKPPTAEQIESITKQAYEAGFEEGYRDGQDKGFETGSAEGRKEGLETGHKEGYDQGLAKAQTEINQKLAQLESLMRQLVNPISMQQQLVEEAMLNVAVALSRAVIHRELSLDSSSLSLTLSQVIEELPALDAGAHLRINAQDREVVESVLSGMNASLELINDASVQAGGFLLKTASQLIDYTVQKRFQKAVQGMLDSAVNQKSSKMQEVPSNIEALSDYPVDTLSEDIPKPEGNEEHEFNAEPASFEEIEEASKENEYASVKLEDESLGDSDVDPERQKTEFNGQIAGSDSQADEQEALGSEDE